jgi:hypothetical protein
VPDIGAYQIGPVDVSRAIDVAVWHSTVAAESWVAPSTVLTPVSSLLELEDGSGYILLEDGSGRLMQEGQTIMGFARTATASAFPRTVKA